MTNVHERGVAGTITLASSALQQPVNQAAIGTSSTALLRSPDSIRRLSVQPMPAPTLPVAGGGIGGGANGIIQQLLNIIRQLLSAMGLGGLGVGGFGGNSWTGPQGNEQYFQRANGSSAGDPHLSFNGTTSSDTNDSTKFDSMTGHNDLLDSDSFAGGYQISTSVTQPGANGVTYNQQATISTNFGNTQVSLDKNGNASIVTNGQTISLANGQSYDLGNGESVTRNADGSVAVTDNNGMGGNITTTLSENGQGVDVNTQASNADLGGDLLNQPGQMVPLNTPNTPNTLRHHHHHHRIGAGGEAQPINYEMAL